MACTARRRRHTCPVQHFKSLSAPHGCSWRCSVAARDLRAPAGAPWRQGKRAAPTWIVRVSFAIGVAAQLRRSWTHPGRLEVRSATRATLVTRPGSWPFAEHIAALRIDAAPASTTRSVLRGAGRTEFSAIRASVTGIRRFLPSLSHHRRLAEHVGEQPCAERHPLWRDRARPHREASARERRAGRRGRLRGALRAPAPVRRRPPSPAVSLVPALVRDSPAQRSSVRSRV